MRTLTFKIPFPPSVHRFRLAREGNYLKSGECREFVDSIVQAFQGRDDLLDASDFYSIQTIIFPPNRKRRAISDVFKLVYDALAEAKIWKDESQIVESRSIFGPAVEDSFVVVKISTFVYPIDRELIPETWGETTRSYDWTKDSSRAHCFSDKDQF